MYSALMILSVTGLFLLSCSNSSTKSTSDAFGFKSCKRGVAYGHHSKADMEALAPGIRWWYNWHYEPEAAVQDSMKDWDVEYVPMWWGAGVESNALHSALQTNARYLLGFNEPNFGSQSNLSALQAAHLWPQLEAVAGSRSLRLVSPAVNFCGGDCHSDGPVEYLQDFLAACTQCQFDYIAIHIYVGCRATDPGLQGNRAQWLINHVEMYKSAFSKPLWLTEFACDGSPSPEEQRAFLKDAVEYLEKEPRIYRYAWFSGRAENMSNVDLLGKDGELTELGEAYVEAPFDTSSCSP